MKVALYSTRARQAVRTLRDKIARLGVGSSAAEMIAFRESEFEDPSSPFATMHHWLDLYSTSELRDLMFHSEEHTFELDELRRALDELMTFI